MTLEEKDKEIQSLRDNIARVTTERNEAIALRDHWQARVHALNGKEVIDLMQMNDAIRAERDEWKRKAEFAAENYRRRNTEALEAERLLGWKP